MKKTSIPKNRDDTSDDMLNASPSPSYDHQDLPGKRIP